MFLYLPAYFFKKQILIYRIVYYRLQLSRFAAFTQKKKYFSGNYSYTKELIRTYSEERTRKNLRRTYSKERILKNWQFHPPLAIYIIQLNQLISYEFQSSDIWFIFSSINYNRSELAESCDERLRSGVKQIQQRLRLVTHQTVRNKTSTQTAWCRRAFCARTVITLCFRSFTFKARHISTFSGHYARRLEATKSSVIFHVGLVSGQVYPKFQLIIYATC